MNEGFDFWGIGSIVRPYEFSDKEQAKRSYQMYMLDRIQQMFVYDNLPETISKRAMEFYLLTNGHCAIIDHDGLYACFGNFGGEPDPYYIPTKYVIANPYLNVFNTFTRDVDCVVIKNDSTYTGIMPMFNRYSELLVETDISFRVADINSRILSLIEAPDDRTYQSALDYLTDVENGELGVIAGNAFLDGVKTAPYSASASHDIITSLIELYQYVKANWYMELGLNANFNMKRESITASESQLNDDLLFPLVDDFLACRQEGVEQINKMFGTNISVRYGSTWSDNQKELELEHEIMENEANPLQSTVTEGGENNVSSEENDDDASLSPDD